MCSKYDNRSVCGGRNAIAYDSCRSNCGCGHNNAGSAYDNCGCGNVGGAYDDNCGCSHNNSASNCGCNNNDCSNGQVGSCYDNNCGCNGNVGGCNGNVGSCNVLGCAACGAVSTVFRIIRGLDRSICGCGNGRNCGCGY